MSVSKLKSDVFNYIWAYDACDPASDASRWRYALQIMAMVARDLYNGMLRLRAMSLVYTTLLSIVPLLAVSISVLKGFGVHGQLERMLTSLLAPIGELGLEISARIVGFVENMEVGVLGTLGLSLLIFIVLSLIQKIESAFNYTWHIKGKRNLIQRMSNYLSVILVGPVLIFSASGITTSLGSSSTLNLLNQLPYIGELTRWILSHLLVIAAFMFIYILVPNTRVRVKSAFIGAVIAVFLWESAGVIFKLFIASSTSYAAIYSGFAIVLLFMIWLYLNWLILLVGASIAYYHQHPECLKWLDNKGYLSVRMREQLALQVMLNIAMAYDQRSDMSPTVTNLAQYQQVPVDVLMTILATLEADGLVRQSNDKSLQYLPARSLEHIKLFDILCSARDAQNKRQTIPLQSDASVSALLNQVERETQMQLKDQTLADLIKRSTTGEI